MNIEVAGQGEFNFGEGNTPSGIDPALAAPQSSSAEVELVSDLLTSLRAQKVLRGQLLSTLESMVDLGMINKSPGSYGPVFDLLSNNLKPLSEKELLQLVRMGNKLQASHEFLEAITRESLARFEEYPTYEALEKLVKPTLENSALVLKVQAELTTAIEFLIPILEENELFDIVQRSAKAKILDVKLVTSVIERLHSLQAEGELGTEILKSTTRILTTLPCLPPNSLTSISNLLLNLLDTQQGDDLIEATIYLGRVDQIDSTFAYELIGRILENPESLSGEGCERLFQLCVEAGIKDRNLLMKALERLIAVSSHTEINKLVDCSRHLSSMNFRSPRLFAIIGAQAEYKLSVVSSDRLRNIVGDCAQLNIIPPALLSFVDREISKREITTHGLCDIIFSFARLNFPCPELLGKFERQFSNDLLTTWHTPSEIASLMWSLAIHKPELALKVWDAAQEMYRRRFAPAEVANSDSANDRSWIKFDNLNSPSYHGLYHALVAMKIDVPESVLQRVKKATGYAEYGPHKTNLFEQSVEHSLKKLGVDFRSQYYFEGYILDFLVQIGNRVIALECDGIKYHIAGRQSQGVMNGSSTIKTRFLQNRGFEVIRILSDDWQNAKDPAAYLSKVLKIK